MLIIDDHDFFRAGLRSILVESGFEVAGEGSSGEAAEPLIERRQPDVVLMDLNMPGISGVEATRKLTAAGVEVPVIVLTVSSRREDLFDALEAGAAGYLLKNAEPQEIAKSIRAALAGDAPLSPGVARHLIARSRAQATRGERTAKPAEALTARELEVLRLLAEGLDNAQIAAALFLSPSTVKRQISSILVKLGAANRVQAAIYGVRAGIL